MLHCDSISSTKDHSVYYFMMNNILVNYALWINSKDSNSYALCDFWTMKILKKEQLEVGIFRETNEISATGI
jgi:hypothetical protein